MLLYLAPSDSFPNIVLRGFTLSEFYFKKLDQAGQIYQNIITYGNREGLVVEKVIKDDVSEGSSEDEFVETMKFDDDYYELLGIKDREMVATPDEIKKAYYKMSLKFHPDKLAVLPEKEKTEKTEHYIKIQKAYDCLSSKNKRHVYDSTLPFDDSIPEYSEKQVEKNPENFYTTFYGVFERNAIYSKDTAPTFGNENTDLDKVNDFYTFWYQFKSWRDFKLDKAYDLDSGENAFEKREMMKENKRLKKGLKKEESQRVQKLVNLAYNLDPRIKKFKILEAERIKQKKIQDKEDKKRENEEQMKKMKDNIVNLRDNYTYKTTVVIERDTTNDYLEGIMFTKKWTFKELTQLQQSLRNLPVGYPNRIYAVHVDVIKYGVRKDIHQLQSKMEEFQKQLKSGGNLLEWMKKSCEEDKVTVKNAEAEKLLNDLDKDKPDDGWTTDQVYKLKQGLKDHATEKDARIKFKKIAEMCGKDYKECIAKVKSMQNKKKK